MNNSGGVDGEDMGFHDGGNSKANCTSSCMIANSISEEVPMMAMSSMPTLERPPISVDPFFTSGWDTLASLSHSENYGSSSLVSHGNFSSYPVLMDNQGFRRNGSTQLAQCLSDPRLQYVGSDSAFEMVGGSFGLPELNHLANLGSLPNSASNISSSGCERMSEKGTQSWECQNSGEEPGGSSAEDGRRKRSPNPNSQCCSKNNKRDNSDVPRLHNEKKKKIEQPESADFPKSNTKQSNDDSSDGGEAPKGNYIHVRARRGQATNSHSLAERVRREKISERMRMLQDLVPGCNKITGKAVMLDEIINYVQSLQQQVEFLSMKLSTLIPGLSIDLEKALSRETIHLRGGGVTNLALNPGISLPHLHSQGVLKGTLPILLSKDQYPPLSQAPLDGELQVLYDMGFDSISGRMKSEQRM